ncbi:MAG: bifunctional diaminohydroxyphosphoribosylaminopyrimidine deaminase/5-amino-6-(5-phosphoribosylamino)uracil reductase RibD [Pseudomonadota bacterium]
MNKNYIEFMREAITLAKLARNKTLPNPRVGAVIFDEQSNALGRGYHKSFGSDHAEVEAINDAIKNGFSVKGTNLCVTLEPCNHDGKTPPCCEAIIRSGIKKVIIGAADDCKDVCGCGTEKLKAAGIQVETGVIEEECRAINPGFHKFNETGLPYIHIKYAVSLDGANGGKVGGSATKGWFTGEKARKTVHEFRANSDLVITGVGTIKADDPKFNSRFKDETVTNRIAILDAKLELFEQYKNRTLNIFKVHNDVVVITGRSDKTKELEAAKIKVIEADVDGKANTADKIDLARLIPILSKKYGYREIFVEAGASVISSFLSDAKNYVDRVTLFVATKNSEDAVMLDGRP